MSSRLTPVVLLCLLPPLAACGSDDGQSGRAADTSIIDQGHACGNGVIESPWERCDDGDGGADGGAGNGAYGKCNADCTDFGPRCGDGVMQGDFEACDDGPSNGQYGYCAGGCQEAGLRCGDGTLQPEVEACDDGEDNGKPARCNTDCSGVVPGCGDGLVSGPSETCDDGEDNGDYGFCGADCAGPGPRCGDGVVQSAAETCDSGPDNGSYGACQADCQAPGPFCGDGTLDSDNERCDDGTDNGQPGSCRTDCSGNALAWTVWPNAEHAEQLWQQQTCTPHDGLSIYLEMRRRLRGDGTPKYPGFVVIGQGPGKSFVASRRQPNQDCHNWWGFGDCPKADDPNAKGLYNWGDGTIWHGEYMSVLAMEYAMFSRLGLPTDETLSDIRWAVEAFNRVDEAAEPWWGVAPARDGLFLRDDVPDGMQLQANGDYTWPRDPADPNNESGALGYECVSADTSCHPPAADSGNITSQDQVIGLMVGWSLLNRLVPEGTVVDGVDIRAEVRDAVHRSVMHMRGNGWKIMAPDGEIPPDAWGGNAIGFSDAMAKVANAIVGDALGVDDYRDLKSKTLGATAWSGIDLIWDQTIYYNRTMAMKLATAGNLWNQDKISRRAQGDAKDYYALTHAIVNGVPGASELSPWRFDSIIDSMNCDGPCREVAGCASPRGWAGESRILTPQDNLGSRHFGSAEFNGLDWMAYYLATYLWRDGAMDFQPQKAPLGCEATAFQSLADIREGVHAPEAVRYDAANACSAYDIGQNRFCGRSWAKWLDDAYAGRATIFTAGGRWVCEEGQPCTITTEGSDATRGYSDGDDLILGSSAADTLRGGDGNDCIIGFGGADMLEGGQGYDRLEGGEGDDTMYGDGEGLSIAGDLDELYGGPGDDTIEGGPGADRIYGESGDDTIDGGNGSDQIDGGPGADTIEGGLGDDTIDGGPGDDSLRGSNGGDTIWGGPGRDRLDGELGDDFLAGGDGDDFVRGGFGDDGLILGPGLDRGCGNSGDDVIWGNWDGDSCLGGSGILAGTDQVNGCMTEAATRNQCKSSAFYDW